MSDISFDKLDAEAAIQEQRRNNALSVNRPKFERLLAEYQTTTVSYSTLHPGEGLVGLERALDILRHEYLNCLYDMKLWKIRSNDEYPSRRIAAMEKFLQSFDDSLR